MTSRKVRNIESAKLPKNVPLLSMTPKQMDETFMDMGGHLDEGLIGEARSGKAGPMRLVSLVLKLRDGSEKLLRSYEEYGDGENGRVLLAVFNEYTPFLHEGESLRMATHDVDLSLAHEFEFPAEKQFKDRSWRQTYELFHDVRGSVTVLVTWLVARGKRLLVTWDVDHGNGSSMTENVKETLRSITYNKILTAQEKLLVVAYDVPPAALHEVSNLV
jgi:hypothetical protein